jgi:hypothetical protein
LLWRIQNEWLGVNQPAAYKNKPAIPAIIKPIAVSRMIKLAFRNSVGGSLWQLIQFA